MRPEPAYKVGDMIRVVSVDDCKFGKNEEMIAQIGRDAKIINVTWERWRDCYKYHISGPGGHWMWSENCFEPTISDLPEFEVESVDAVLGLFS